MSPIHELKGGVPRFKELGRIGLGHLVTKIKNGREVTYPVADDHFVLTRAPELVEIYGGKPKKLNIFFPFDEIDRNLDAWHRLYGSGSLKCRGDGKVVDICLNKGKFVVSNGICQHAFSENGQSFERGDVMPCGGFQKIYPKCKDCVPRAYLRIMIHEVMEQGRLGYYQISTQSKNGILNIQGALGMMQDLVLRLTGKPYLAGIPMILSLGPQNISQPRIDKQTGETYRVRGNKYILSLEPHPDWIKAQMDSWQRQTLAAPEYLQLLQTVPEPETTCTDFDTGDLIDIETGQVIEHRTAEAPGGDMDAVMGEIVSEVLDDDPRADLDILARDVEAIQTLGNLWTACLEDFGLDRSHALKELGVTRQEHLAEEPRELYRRIAAVRLFPIDPKSA